MVTISGPVSDGIKKNKVPQISYLRFSEILLGSQGERRLPIKGSIELTLRCNLNCAHCYVRLPLHNKKAQRDELSLAEICKLLDDAARAGCMWLLFTGGEPLVRPDFTDIFTYAKKKGFLLSLFTNGTLLTGELVNYLREYSPYQVEITLYGITADIHERVTRVPGSFQRSIDGINLLMTHGIPFNLKTMAMNINRHEIPDLSEFARKIGVKFRYDPIINAGINGSREPLQLRLTPEQVLELELSDEKRADFFQEFSDKFRCAPGTEGIYGCGAGLYNFHVDPYGHMSLCMSARWPGYDLRHGSFEEGFYNFFPQVRSQKPRPSYPCASCEIHSFCSNCPGTAYAETGDQEAVVDYYCQIARLRAGDGVSAGNKPDGQASGSQ